MNIKKISFVLTCVWVFLLICPVEAESEEVMLLASAAEAVAGGESYTVMAAFSSVMLNRVRNENYPSSLAAVILDAGIDISAVKVSPRSIRAARDALGGFDPTGGALHYSREEKDLPKILLGVPGWSFY
ncbi:MAG: cell wall hydrolase [Clostridia bacterium]|nr:cell wall hydrolase [Clostridia bacterium]